MSSALEYNMSYDAIPVSKRIENSTNAVTQQRSNILGRDIDWKVGLNKPDVSTGMTPIMVAAMQGRLELVLALLERGAILDLKDEKKGRTALHYAAKGGQCHVVIELMKRDAIVNNQDNFNKTPLILASKNGYLDCVNALLGRGAGVNMSDSYGCTALHYAAKFGHHEVACRLMDMAAAIEIRDNDEGFAPLHFAAKYGRKETVLRLLHYGAKPNRRSTKDKVTPLMLACKEGNKSIASILIRQGGDCHFTDIFGWTPLHYAASWGRRDTAHIVLVEGKANPNLRTKTSEGKAAPTTLIIAVKGSQLEIIKLLLHYGADINQPELLYGQNPLAFAAETGKIDSMQVLLDYSVEINFQNPLTGSTALMTAAYEGHRNCIMLLLNYFADMNILDKRCWTVWDYAAKRNQSEGLLLSILSLHPSAKVNVLPWLETKLPLLLHTNQPHIGGSSIFLNEILYSKKGLYYGIYQLTGDYDIYLIYSLVMILIICQKSLQYQYAIRHQAIYQQHMNQIERMLSCSVNAFALCNDFMANDVLVIGNFPTILLNKEQQFHMKYMTNAIWFGPLALYVFHDRKEWLGNYTMQEKINALLWTNSKDPTVLVDGYGARSKYLLFRYAPVNMFLLEGCSHVTFLGLIMYQCCVIQSSYDFMTQEYLSSSSNKAMTMNTGIWSMSEMLLAVYTISFVLYEIGLLEEKRWALSPSIIYDSQELEQQRFKQMKSHFLDSPWKLMDLWVIIGSLLWLALRVYSATSSTDGQVMSKAAIASQCLVTCTIPLAVGLIRYPACFLPSLHVESLVIYMICKDIMIYVVFFLVIGVGFAVPYYAIFHEELHAFNTPQLSLQTLFNAILRNYDDNLFRNTANESLGLVLSVLFLLFFVIVLLNCIIGTIVTKYASRKEYCVSWHYFLKFKYIQQYSLVLEKSALCMLPPPLTLFPVFLYPIHINYIWKSRLALEKEKCISIAGTFADMVLGVLTVIPSAIYEYIVLEILEKERRGYAASILWSVIGIPYIMWCLLWKTVAEEPTIEVLLKTRITDGRLRIKYSYPEVLREHWEDVTLTRFEDMRMYKSIENFSLYVMKKGMNGEEILPTDKNKNNNYNASAENSFQDSAKYDMSEINTSGKSLSGKNLNTSSKLVTAASGRSMKGAALSEKAASRSNISLQEKTGFSGKLGSSKIFTSDSPSKENIFSTDNQLGSVSGHSPSRMDFDVDDDYDGLLNPDPTASIGSVPLFPSMMRRMLKPFQKREIDYLGDRNIRIAPQRPFIQLNRIHTIDEVKTGLPTIIEHEKGTKADPTRPVILSAQDIHSDHAMSMLPDLDNLSQVGDAYGNDLRPAVLWTENDGALSFHQPVGINPYQPGILNANQWDELAAETEIGPTMPAMMPSITYPGYDDAMPSTYVGTPFKSYKLEESESKLEDPAGFKYPSKVNQSEEEVQQSKDSLLRINYPSVYYTAQRFPSIFSAKERKTIFEEVLPEVFVDDFAYAVERNEENVLHLKQKIKHMEDMQFQQLQMMQTLIEKLNYPYQQ